MAERFAVDSELRNMHEISEDATSAGFMHKSVAIIGVSEEPLHVVDGPVVYFDSAFCTPNFWLPHNIFGFRPAFLSQAIQPTQMSFFWTICPNTVVWGAMFHETCDDLRSAPCWQHNNHAYFGV